MPRRARTGLPHPGPVHGARDQRGAARPRGSVSAVSGVTGPADWRDLEQGAPELAQLGLSRLRAAGVAMLGTLRPDGSPRISPIEPYLVRGQLLVGAMTWSTKAADLLRDPRYVLHSTVTGPDNGEGELKLHGSATQASQRLRAAATQAWWSGQPREQAVVFSLRIATGLFIEWDIGRALITVHRWSPCGGYSHTTRGYP
jgi:Pyridoxamine 5'-phosphate oxidase